MNRALGAAAALILTISVAGAGCTASSSTPPASDTADALAKALSTGDLAGVRFHGQSPRSAQRWWDEVVENMGGTQPAVHVAGVDEADGSEEATARLAYRWEPVAGGTRWTYDTTARLTRTGDAWAVEPGPKLLAPTLRTGETLALTKDPGRRGDILGAGGARLVTERPVLRFGIDKTQVAGPRQAASARRLAELVGVDAGGYVDQVRASGDEAFVEAMVLRKYEVDPRVRRGYPAIKGAVAIPDRVPLAVTREFARPILGTVGPVTAEIIKESDGEYSVGDEAGLSGLEQRYDETLRGTPGFVVEAVAAKSGDRRKLFRAAPEPGRPLRTTLDEKLQLLADELLADVGPASALVAVRPSDGALLAAASGPGSNGYSTATVGTYAPGSTFKIVSSLALLRAGLTPASKVSCPVTTTVDGKGFKNYDDYPASGFGTIALRDAVANSCNTAFISQRGKVSQADIADAAAALGLGVDHDIGFPAYFGAVPRSATDTGHAAALIGQGEVLASPMAMAAVVASVAEGRTVVPRLLADKPTGGPEPPTPLTAREASQLRSMLRAVVTRGSGVLLLGLPGAPVIAKTGTAEFGTDVPPQTHAWMVAAQGDLAVAAFVDVGESGSGTAGPILEEFLRRSR